MTPDLVVLGARLLDPVAGLLPHTALAAADGLVVAMGDDRELRSLAGPRTTVVDVHGAVVTPGLVDGHMHPVSGAERTLGVDLSTCEDLSGLRSVLAAEVRGLADGAWLRGWGLDPNVFGDQPVATSSLHGVLGGVPAILELFDAHSVLASPVALALAGVDGPRRFDQAAEVVCDADGRPTGLLLEDAACDLVDAVAPRLTTDELRRRTAEVFARMAAAGLTGGHVMDANGESLAVLDALDERRELSLRLRVAPWCQPGTSGDELDELVRLQGTGGRLWHVGGVKIFMDGTIDNGTAWLERPDAHGESAAAFWPDPSAYTAVVGRLHARGIPVATHAIGDAAVRHVLDSIGKAHADVPTPVRHRVEHIETVPDDTVRRFAVLGVTASMQPTHCTDYTRADHSDNWSRRLGEERASQAWRCRDIVDAGARVVLGSDWPIAPFAPLGVMAGARHRRPSRDLSRPPHGPGQALTPHQALVAMTVNPAWVAGDDRAGRLAVGGRADLTCFADDPLRVPDTDLAGMPVVLTVVSGRPVHRSPAV